MERLIDKIKKYDTAVLRFINMKIKCRPLDIIMPIITYMGSIIVCTVIALLLYFSSRYHVLGTRIVLTLLLSNIIVMSMKYIIKRLRPYQVFEFLNVKKIEVDKYSFPSGHANIAFSLITPVILTIKGIGLILLIIPIIVSISRVYIGVHYPSDVVAGMIVGNISTLIIFVAL